MHSRPVVVVFDSALTHPLYCRGSKYKSGPISCARPRYFPYTARTWRCLLRGLVLGLCGVDRRKRTHRACRGSPESGDPLALLKEACSWLSTLREPITVVVSRKSTNSGAAEPLVTLTTLSVTSVRGGSDFSVCRRGFFADRDHCCLYVITVSLIVIIEQKSCRAVVVVEFHHFRLPGHPGRWNQARYRTYQRPI